MSESLTIFLGMVVFALVAFAFITGSWVPIVWLAVIFIAAAGAMNVTGGGKGGRGG